MKRRGTLSLLALPLFFSTFILPLASCTHVVAKANGSANEAVPVRTARAVSADVPLEVPAVGNVEATESIDVKSRVAGQINRVAFNEGQNVSKGQLLFSIDREAIERQVMEEQATLERDRAMAQQARAVAARDAAAAKQSQSEADVARQLGTLGVISMQRVSQLVATSDSAEASLQADQAAEAAAAGTVKADRARLAETQLQLRFTDVVAPISGRAGAMTVKAGNMVRDNDTTLVTLRQLTPIYVTFAIPEQRLAEVRRLSAGGLLAVDASVDAANSGNTGKPSAPVRDGHLVFIDNSVDTATGTIRLKAVFPNADNALWPGEFVHVRLRLGMDKGSTVVPESAIQDGLDGRYVWVIKYGVATTAPVTMLRTYRPPSNSEQAVIGEGVTPGDTVVTEGQLRLTLGAAVRILDTPGKRP